MSWSRISITFQLLNYRPRVDECQHPTGPPLLPHLHMLECVTQHAEDLRDIADNAVEVKKGWTTFYFRVAMLDISWFTASLSSCSAMNG